MESPPNIQCRRQRFYPWVRKIPWRRKWQPTSVFLPDDFHEQRSLMGYSLKSPVGDWKKERVGREKCPSAIRAGTQGRWDSSGTGAGERRALSRARGHVGLAESAIWLCGTEMWCERHNSTIHTAPGQELPNADHMLGETANTGREIEQSRGEMISEYVPGRKGRFISPYLGWEIIWERRRQKRLTHVKHSLSLNARQAGTGL